MPLPTNIENLLKGSVVEHERIEFKESWDAVASLKTICAFANDMDNWGGGYLVVGVAQEDDGALHPVGIPVAKVDTWLKDMVNKCKLIRPDYMPVCDVATFEGKTFIVLWCPGGSVRPYSAPTSLAKGTKERVCYIRKMASTVQPSPEDLRELYSLADNVPFDDRPNHAAELADLDITLIKAFLREVGSDLYAQATSMDFEDLCRAMQIVDGPREYVKPKNVGLLFFNDDPRRFFPCTQIDVVEFPDGLGGDRIIEHTFSGPLDRQLKDAMNYLGNMVVAERVVKVPDRAEAQRCFNYPYAALEEALANAVYHKGYDVREPIEVRVLPDRIEVLSYPGADRSISIEGLKHFKAITRRYRNRRVGDFLKELHLTEGRNTGIYKILQALRANGSPDPQFETDEDRLYFLVTIRIHEAFVEGSGSGATAHGAAGVRLTERERQVLDFFSATPDATLAAASQELGIPTATLSRILSKLKGLGLVRREGNNRSGKWVLV